MPGTSLVGRFAAAVALTVGFYLLAVGLAGGLLFLAVWPWTEGSQPVVLSITCVFLAGSILAAIVPRRIAFDDPGLRITRDGEPRLFALIEDEAAADDERAPDEVFLTMEANAAVAQVSRTRRVMIVGVALMQLLTERELRGVIAHEFGHYRGGDTRLGTWIYRTRETIARTIDRLSADESISRIIVRQPFIWYGKAFLRITAAISRRQEFAADARAVERVGREPFVEGLRKVHSSGVAFDHYWAGEVVPVLQAGRRPPVAEGFRRFTASESIGEATREQLRVALEERHTDPYDSHPSLAERIAAVERLPGGEQDTTAPAIDLLSDPETVERRVLDALIGPQAGTFRPVGWDEVGVEIYVARARRFCEDFRVVIDGVTLGSLPAAVAAIPATAHRIAGPEDHPPALEDLVASVLADGVLLALYGAGWIVSAAPGHPVTAARAADVIAPHLAVRELRAGALSAVAWRARLETLGLAEQPLG